jgi:hypothetical protein
MVGRRDEMAALNAALEQALQGNTQVVGVVGEAGVGKSRLCEEFARTCEERGLTVRRAHGVSYGKAIPMLPVLQLFRNYFEIAEEDSAQKAREKVAGRLVLLDPSFEEDLPIMFDFLEPLRIDSQAPEGPVTRRTATSWRRASSSRRWAPTHSCRSCMPSWPSRRWPRGTVRPRSASAARPSACSPPSEPRHTPRGWGRWLRNDLDRLAERQALIVPEGVVAASVGYTVRR